jgi:AcrR family transcriptional regulator
MALPRGRHELSPGEVETDQRRRMLAGLAGALAEQGYARVTVSDVLERAGVSRRTFYEQFADKDDCFYAAYDDAERRAWVATAEAVAATSARDWPARVHAAVAAALEFVAAEPDTARLFTLEARAAGPEMAARHGAALDRIAALLRAGNRPAGRDGSNTDSAGLVSLPETTERTLVANVAALIGSYVISGAAELLPGLEPQLGEHLLSPYRETTR